MLRLWAYQHPISHSIINTQSWKPLYANNIQTEQVVFLYLGIYNICKYVLYIHTVAINEKRDYELENKAMRNILAIKKKRCYLWIWKGNERYMGEFGERKGKRLMI